MAKKSATTKSTNDGKPRLREILNECDPRKLIEFFQDMPEEERKGYASICLEFARNRWDFTIKNRLPENREYRKLLDKRAKAIRPDWDYENCIWVCASIAVVATANLRQIRGAQNDNRILLIGIEDYIVPVLRHRTQEMFLGIMEIASELGPMAEKDNWKLYRRMVKEHVFMPSQSDRWIGIMFDAFIYLNFCKT